MFVATRMALLVVVGSVLTLASGCGGQNGHTSGTVQLGPGMMGSRPADSGSLVRTLADARERADAFAAQLDLRAGEVMQFSNGYYVELLDKAGAKATEVLVDSQSGAAWIEYGPAMMWNTRYGMMGSTLLGNAPMGMMGGRGMMDGTTQGWDMMGRSFRGDPTWTPFGGDDAASAIPPLEARQLADRWLAENADGLSAGEAESFPGYYTLHVLRGSELTGMLSVNAYTGAVWYHWWHGRFVAMEEA